MKKLLAAAFLALLFTLPLLAEETEKSKPIWDHGDNVSDLSIKNIRLYKVLDQQDGYVILYEKEGLSAGRIVIPKDWYNQRPAKLEFSTLAKGISPYMTIIKRDGKLVKMIICVSPNRRDSVWGVIKPWEKLPVCDEDSFNL